MSPPALAPQRPRCPPVFELEGQVDPGSVSELHGAIATALADGHHLVVIDLYAVLDMSTQALSELCAGLRRVSATGRRLAIVGSDLRIRWVLQVCQIDGLELHTTIETALASPPSDAEARPRSGWRELLAMKRPRQKRSAPDA